MGFIQANKITINMNLKNEYHLVHFSDVHAITYYEEDSEDVKQTAKNGEEAWMRVRQDFAKHFNESYSDEQLIPTAACLEKIVNYVNEVKPNAVVLAGDIIDYYSEANLDYLMQSCASINYPFIFTCGNHETPANRYDDITNGASDFNVLELFEFKIIGIDDSTKTITPAILKKFKKELRSSKPIIVAMHIPVMTDYNKDEMSKFDKYFVIDHNNCDETTKEFIDLMIHSPQVKALLCGHVHGQSVSMFAKDKYQYCSSSGLIGFVNEITIK